MNISISNLGATRLSSTTRNRLKHEVHKNLGVNVLALSGTAVPDSKGGINGCIIYTDQKDHDPVMIFRTVIQNDQKKNYLFGMLEIKRTHQMLFFLIDIQTPLYISENNQIVSLEEDVKMYVKGN